MNETKRHRSIPYAKHTSPQDEVTWMVQDKVFLTEEGAIDYIDREKDKGTATESLNYKGYLYRKEDDPQRFEFGFKLLGAQFARLDIFESIEDLESFVDVKMSKDAKTYTYKGTSFNRVEDKHEVEHLISGNGYRFKSEALADAWVDAGFPDMKARIVVPKKESYRDTISARFDLIPGDVLQMVAEVFGHGAQKYGDSNWKESRLKGADSPINHALKHINLYNAGIPDDESDDPNIHMSHAIVNLMFELYYNLHESEYEK